MTNHKSKVSIIVPVYNLQDYIGQCVQSLISQTYTNLEIILIDDGSTDNSLPTLKSFARKDDRIVVLHQENNGAAAARNAGLKRASGEYIMFVDGDDSLSKDTISLNLKYFIDPELDWVEFPIKRINSEGMEIYSTTIGESFCPDKEYYVPRNKLVEWFLNKRLSRLVCGGIYRSQSIKGLTFPEHQYYEDSFFFLDIMTRTKKGKLSPNGCYYYLERATSAQHSYIDEKRLASKTDYDIKFLTDIPKYFPKDKNLIITQHPDLYYYYKLQVAKNIPGAQNSLHRISAITGLPNLSVSRKLKLMIFQYIGYNTIKRIAKRFRI